MQSRSEFVVPGPPGQYNPIRPLAYRQTNQEVSTLVRWAFYAFVFTILFEAAPIGINVETTQITAMLLIATLVFFQPRIFLQSWPAALGYLLVYFFVGIVVLAADKNLFDREILLRQIKFLQLLLLFWISFNLMRNERTARGALISLVVSGTTLSVLQMLGLTTTTESVASSLSRFTAFGLDSNHIAGILALGMLAAVGFAYEKKTKRIALLPLILPAIAVMGLTIVRTGARGGMLALIAGVLVFALGKGAFSHKIRNVCVVLILILFFGLIAYQSELVKRRFQQSWEDGNLSERERVYPLAVEMILERPLLGFGPVMNSVELGQRVQLYHYERMDPHNLLFYILTSTGIVGAIPFFASVWLCVRAAWRARAGTFGILPFALTVTLLTSEMSVTGFHWKHHWIVLGFALASGSHLAPSRWQRIFVRQTSSPFRPGRFSGLNQQPQLRTTKLT